MVVTWFVCERVFNLSVALQCHHKPTPRNFQHHVHCSCPQSIPALGAARLSATMSQQVYHAMRHSQSSFETGPGSDYDFSDDQSIAGSFLAGMASIEADMDCSHDGDDFQDRSVSQHHSMAICDAQKTDKGTKGSAYSLQRWQCGDFGHCCLLWRRSL